MGHHWDEYDTKGAHVQDVDVSSSLKAAREEEERKNLAKKPKMPGDEFEYKVGGVTASTDRNVSGCKADGRRSDRRRVSPRSDINLHRFCTPRTQVEKR